MDHFPPSVRCEGAAYMSARAWFERLLSPGLGTCGRCQRPWKFPARKRDRDRMFGIGVEPHSTPFTESSACFPLCKSCWSALTPEEREPYYQDLFERWWADAVRRLDADHLESLMKDETRILEAVRAGL